MDLYSVVDKRAMAFLRNTADRFEFFRWAVGSDGVLNFSETGLQSSVSDLTLAFRLSSKLVGRVYSFEWRWGVPADFGDEARKVTLKFDGWKRKTRKTRFDGGESSGDLASKLNDSEKIISLCSAMELIGLEINYRPDAKVCEVVCYPSYGDYIWLLIPPVRYASHPTNAEIDGTILLIEELSRLVASD